MKLKLFFSLIGFLLFFANNTVHATTFDQVQNLSIVKKSINNNNLYLDKGEVVEVNLNVNLIDDTTEKAMTFSCSIDGTLTIKTESGKSVRVTFSVTANTCKEAREVFNTIVSAFE